MKIHLNVFLILSIIFLVNYCDGQIFRIMGGEEVTISQYPYQCSFESNGEMQCGCSIISSKCFITAGHCTYMFNDNITVRAGSTMKESGGDVYKIIKTVTHSQFNMRKIDVDFSILIPDRDIKINNVTVKPILLPKKNQVTPDNTLCYISGWGKANNISRPVKLRAADVRIMNRDQCQFLYNSTSVKYTITDYMLCAGYMEGIKDTCNGDSGGPLACTTNNGLMLTGIISSGYGCALPRYPGIYADVSKVRDWIFSNCGV